MRLLSTSGTRSTGRILAPAVLALALAAGAHAQWTVVNLSPGTGSGSAHASWVGGLDGAQQVGNTGVQTGPAAGNSRACLWTGTAASRVDLHPAGAFLSAAGPVDDGQQAGWARVPVGSGSQTHAGLWSGTAASWVDLNPAGSISSIVIGAGGGQQAGRATVGGVLHAGLWTGTAASWVDLHPAGFARSQANDTDGVHQVGVAITPTNNFHACMWSGTAASFVDLNPAGVAGSGTQGVDGDQQVGDFWRGPTDDNHAGLWIGTAESLVDLQPAGVGGPAWNGILSQAFAVHGGKQVGRMFMSDMTHAILWSGTADSWVDLRAFQPAGLSWSEARSVWTDGCALRVGGIALNDAAGHYDAVMWVHSFPWSNFLPPVNPDGSSRFRQGRTVPVKFRLLEECASYATLDARLYVAPVIGGVPGPESPAESSGGSNNGNRFRYAASDDQYVFNLDTRNLGAGTWQLRADLGDYVTTHTVLITLE